MAKNDEHTNPFLVVLAFRGEAFLCQDINQDPELLSRL